MKIELIDTRNNLKLFNFAIKLIFEEWGDGDINHLTKKKLELKTNYNYKCFVLLVDKNPVGCFVIRNDDIKEYPEFNPNLACVCIDKKYRGLGYSKIMLEEANKVFKKLNITKVYLKTQLNNFYESHGWIYLKDVSINNTLEKIYYHNF